MKIVTSNSKIKNLSVRRLREYVRNVNLVAPTDLNLFSEEMVSFLLEHGATSAYRRSGRGFFAVDKRRLDVNNLKKLFHENRGHNVQIFKAPTNRII